jgi:hypothetical protein
MALKGPGLAPPLSHLLREPRSNAGKEVNVPECPSVAVGASRGCAVASALPRAERSCCHAPVPPPDSSTTPSGATISTINIVQKQQLAALLTGTEQGGALTL